MSGSTVIWNSTEPLFVGGRRVGPTNPFVEFKKVDVEQSIPARFEQQVRRYPDRLAVKTISNTLTYDELNKAANRVSHAVLAQTGESKEPVALLFKQGASMITANLGVLKAGKAYVQIDYSLPRASAARILQNAQADLIVTDNQNLSFARKLAHGPLKVLSLDDLDANLSNQNPGLFISPDQIAYIHYTSGSTGEPKGVIANHRNELYSIMVKTNALHISVDDRISLLRSNNVGATSDALLALLNGASLFPLELKEEGLANLANWLIEEGITLYTCVASVFRHSVRTLTGKEKFPKLRLIHVGGEPVYRTDVKLYKKHFPEQCLFVTRLGISETKTVTYYFVNKEMEIKERIVPVGYPLEGYEVLVIDDDGKEVGVNRVGEIAVKSRYLALGYWREPELTCSKFLPDPGGGDARIYLTGDLGYMLPDGCLVHVGRKDFQVKIRGHRVELPEVEMALLQVPAIKQAAVVSRDDPECGKSLVAYFVPQQCQVPTSSELRRLMKEKLPSYMLPSSFVMLSHLPLTASGKVDRRALPPPGKTRPELESPFAVPRTPVESVVARIWSEVLCVDEVGINDNFFDLGGDSLLASKLISNVSKSFPLRLTLGEFFEAPTVAGMGGQIEKQREGRRSNAPPILPLPREGCLPVSSAQEQLWFLNQLLPGTDLFTLSSAYQLSGSLDVAILKETLKELIRRHEPLRTVFAGVDGEPMQVVGQPLDIELPLVDLSHLPAVRREKETLRLAGREASAPFDLAKGPLIRIKLLRLANDEHVLLVTMHHIISDQWSIQVFWNDLAIIYEALSRGRNHSLPDIPIQFIDFVCWEQRALDSAFMKEQLAYWEKQLAGSLRRLLFKGASRTKDGRSFRTTRLPIEVDENLFTALKDLSRKERSTPFMVLVTALDLTLHVYTGQNDIRIGTLVANRDRLETERLIGHFINTLILRSRVSRNLSLRQLLTQVRDITLAAHAHQNLPFEHLVRALEQKRKITRTSLFQVMFIYHNKTLQIPPIPNLTFKSRDKVWNRPDPGMTFTTLDLILVLKETSKGLVGSFTFKSDLFDSRTGNDMLQTFIRILKYMIAKPESTIARVCTEARPSR